MTYEWDYVVDIDGTICTAIDRDYANAIPNQPLIDRINELYDAGYSILLFTARGQLSYNGDIEQINRYVTPVLKTWLEEHEVKHTKLMMGKPYAKYAYIDDKAMLPNAFV